MLRHAKTVKPSSDMPLVQHASHGFLNCSKSVIPGMPSDDKRKEDDDDSDSDSGRSTLVGADVCC